LGEEIAHFDHEFPVTTLSFRPDGGELATGSSSKSFTKHRVRDAVGNEPSDLVSEYGWFFAPSRGESDDMFDTFP
jgi:hypothetical protein